MPEQIPDSAKALREKRTAARAGIYQMRDKLKAENRAEFSAEEQAAWVTANAEYDALTRQIEIAERHERLAAEEHDEKTRVVNRVPEAYRSFDGWEERGRRPVEAANRDQAATLAIAGWLAVPTVEGPTEDQFQAMRNLGLNPHAKAIRLSLHETADHHRMQGFFRSANPRVAHQQAQDYKAVMSGGAGDSGGYLIAPEQLRNTLELNMLAFGGMRQVAETIRTDTGTPITWPTADDTSNTGEQIGESTDTSNNGAGGNNPTIGAQTWYSYDFHSKMILVPKNLIRDSVFNLPQIIGEMLGERLGRITNTRMTTGTGAATITGIVTSATSFSAASATAIAYDDVIKLEHAIDPAYRNMPGVGYMLHDAIFLQLRLLKDGNGQYLWKNGDPAGIRDTLNNRPLYINQDMDSTMSSGKKSLLFGHFPSYKIRTVGNIELIRLDERYAEYRRVAFDAFISEDAKLLTTTTPRVKYLAH